MKNRKKLAALLSLLLIMAVLSTGCDLATVNGAYTALPAAETSIEFVKNDNMQPAVYTKKVDGDTAYFSIDGNEVKVRFLAIDTPETVKQGTEVEAFGPEASDYTDSRLSSANEIYLEWDDNSDMTDAYGRYLAWVWADGSLLEEELVSLGYAEVAYIYGDYKYVDELRDAENAAKDAGKGIWS